MSAGTTVLVGLAGALGALLRYLVDGAVMRRSGRALPFGTMAVNLSGAFLLGILTGLAASTDATLIAGTGLVGGYTTFSTWMLETQRLVEDRQGRWAVANVVVGLAVGLAAVALGRTLAG